jgi:hypothetical protein
MQVEDFFEPMITSKEPDHSLRGYSQRERWSRTRWNIKRRKEIQTCFLQVIDKEDDEEGNTSEPILEKIRL